MSGLGHIDSERSKDGFCLLLADSAGRVVFRAGTLLEKPSLPDGQAQATRMAVISPNASGSDWRETIASLVVDTLPAKLPAESASVPVVSRSGQELMLHFMPSVQALNGGTLILLDRRDEALSARVRRLQMLGTLAAGAAHEMNNLLTVMLGWLELLMLDEPQDSKRCDRLRNIAEAVERMGELSGSLLNFARMKNGDFAPVNLSTLAQGVIALVDYQLRKDNITVVTNWSRDSVVVLGSEGELSQTLLNLIHNSRQAMPGGGKIWVSTRRDGDWAVLEVEDSGVGISREIQERIFDPFFTTRRDEGGTGLGLAVCKETVQRHGGEIAVESELGAGALFTMRIPITAEPVTADG